MNPSHKNQRSVIFDLDGTLADTLDDLANALNEALTELGYAAQDGASVRAMIGDGMPSLVARAANTDDDVEIERVTASYRAAYARCMLDHTRLYPGIASLLDRMHEGGLGMSVLSNKSHEYTVLMCDALLADWSVRRAQGVVEDALRKPNPTMALELAAELKTNPGDMFFVGDSEVDIETGRRAGMSTIAVTWGYRSEADLIRARPDHVVATPSAVADILLA